MRLPTVGNILTQFSTVIVMESRVIIVGAGPTGLWAAAELRHAGLHVTVIDMMTERGPYSKATTMSAGSLESFATRGIEHRFLDHGVPLHSIHFGGCSTRLQLGTEVLGINHPYNLAIPQRMTEKLLEEHCNEIGVHFIWGQRIVGLSQDEQKVEITTTTETGQFTYEAAWVIGCDGTRSAVRQLAGIDFIGTSSRITGALADVLVTDPPQGPIIISGAAGSGLIQRSGDGDYYRMVFLDLETRHLPTSATPTLEYIRATSVAMFGKDFGLHSPIWLSRFGNATKRATSLRNRRVFIAGDAAHQFFPVGGQGMNTGIQDAANLSWKLIAVAKGRLIGAAAESLLNSYGTERKLANENIIMSACAGTALLVAQEAHEVALRQLVSEGLEIPAFNQLWARRFTGFGDPFPEYEEMQDDLIGKRVSHIHVGSGFSHLHQHMSPESFVLIHLNNTDESILRAAVDPWLTQLHILSSHHDVSAWGQQWMDVIAFLVRPDARVAWVWRSANSVTAVKSSLVKVMQQLAGPGGVSRDGNGPAADDPKSKSPSVSV